MRRRRTGTIGPKPRTCDHCGVSDLAWVKTDDGWKLYPGRRDDDGYWTADRTRPPHTCDRPPDKGKRRTLPPPSAALPTAAATRVEDVPVRVACGCGNEAWMRPRTIARFGLPLCESCKATLQVSVSGLDAVALPDDETIARVNAEIAHSREHWPGFDGRECEIRTMMIEHPELDLRAAYERVMERYNDNGVIAPDRADDAGADSELARLLAEYESERV